MLRLALFNAAIAALLSSSLQAAPGFQIRPDPIEIIMWDRQDIYIEAVGEGWIDRMNLVLGVSPDVPILELHDLRITGAGTMWDQTNCTVSIFDYHNGGTPSPQLIAATVVPEHPVRAPGLVAVVRLDYVVPVMGFVGTMTTDLTDAFGVRSDWGDAPAAFQATVAVLDVPEPAGVALIVIGIAWSARRPAIRRR